MCKKYAEHAAKHLSTAAIEHLNNGLGGNIMANHALLMRRRIPKIPQLVSKNLTWRYGNRPMLFTGTVYTDGSTTINHSFPEARRSGYAAVVIGEQLRDSDNDITIRDDTYRPERHNRIDNLNQEVETSDDEQEPAPVTVTHSARNWPVHIPCLHRKIIGRYTKNVFVTWE